MARRLDWSQKGKSVHVIGNVEPPSLMALNAGGALNAFLFALVLLLWTIVLWCRCAAIFGRSTRGRLLHRAHVAECSWHSLAAEHLGLATVCPEPWLSSRWASSAPITLCQSDSSVRKMNKWQTWRCCTVHDDLSLTCRVTQRDNSDLGPSHFCLLDSLTFSLYSTDSGFERFVWNKTSTVHFSKTHLPAKRSNQISIESTKHVNKS